MKQRSRAATLNRPLRLKLTLATVRQNKGFDVSAT